MFLILYFFVAISTAMATTNTILELVITPVSTCSPTIVSSVA